MALLLFIYNTDIISNEIRLVANSYDVLHVKVFFLNFICEPSGVRESWKARPRPVCK
jgi:hypothetical protein